jgi:hypothetical protein
VSDPRLPAGYEHARRIRNAHGPDDFSLAEFLDVDDATQTLLADRAAHLEASSIATDREIKRIVKEECSQGGNALLPPSAVRDLRSARIEEKRLERESSPILPKSVHPEDDDDDDSISSFGNQDAESLDLLRHIQARKQKP